MLTGVWRGRAIWLAPLLTCSLMVENLFNPAILVCRSPLDQTERWTGDQTLVKTCNLRANLFSRLATFYRRAIKVYLRFAPEPSPAFLSAFVASRD